MLKAALAMVAVLAAGPKETAPPVPLAPAGPWQVNGDADGLCLLSRDYGRAVDRVTVAFQPWPTQTAMEVLILSKAGSGGQRQGKAAIALSPGGPNVEGSYASFRVPGSDRRLTRFTVDRSAFDALPTATAMTLKAVVAVTIAIANAKAAMAVLDQCQTKLLRSPGIDPATKASGTISPVPVHDGPQQGFTSDNDPQAARAPGVTGRVVMDLTIGQDGRVSQCRIVHSAGPTLDRASCEMAKKNGRVRPAYDATGKPVPSSSAAPVRWVIDP